MKASLKKLLKVRHNPAWRGGSKCFTCSHERAVQINRDIKDFFRAKKRGHPMPWAAFVREYLTPEYKMKVHTDTLLGHVRRCLRIEA